MIPLATTTHPARHLSALRILLVDDHALFRTGLRMVLVEGKIAGEIFEASNLKEAMNFIDTPLDVVLLDIQLPGISGLEGVTLLKKHIPHTPIVLLSGQADAETMNKAQILGAAGFVSKAVAVEEVFFAIKEVLAGNNFFSSTLSAVLPLQFKTTATSQTPLTARQIEVLDQLCQGLSNKLIARKLGMAENTVQVHVAAIFTHLGVTNRSKALLVAQQLGMVR